MAKVVKKAKKSQPLSITKKNLYILGLGIVVIIIGFIFMAQPPVNGPMSLTIAPILLIIAYLVIIPIAILYGIHKKDKSGE